MNQRDTLIILGFLSFVALLIVSTIDIAPLRDVGLTDLILLAWVIIVPAWAAIQLRDEAKDKA